MRTKQVFKTMLVEHGYSEEVAEALWKWYDFTDKKGVASF
jgi:Mn-dependent DtxR family transcriptional regulator